MNEPTTPTPPVVPEPPVTVPPPEPATPLASKLLPKVIMAVLAFSAIFTGVVAYNLYLRLQGKTTPVETITVLISPTLAPTPIRTRSQVSQTVPFSSFETEVSSFTALIQSARDDDPMLSIPDIIQPLGL